MSKLRETGLEGVAEEEMLSSESKDLYLTCGGETEKGGVVEVKDNTCGKIMETMRLSVGTKASGFPPLTSCPKVAACSVTCCPNPEIRFLDPLIIQLRARLYTSKVPPHSCCFGK